MSKSLEELNFKEMKELKNVFLAKKQGEALERITNPRRHLEGLGLGYYESDTVLALNALDILENAMNALGTSDDPKLKGDELPVFTATKNMLHDFTRGIGVASGSRVAKRMEKSLETIGTLGQFHPEKGFGGMEAEEIDPNE